MGNAKRAQKDDRRVAVREKAREGRLRQQRQDRRSRIAVQVAVCGVIVAIVAVVALIVVNTARPAGPGPRNMASGGISLHGARLTAITSPASEAGATPTPERTVAGGKVLIQAYEDFGCPKCREFEEQYGAQIKQLVTSGAAVIQYHPVAILDHSFTDNDYSTRAANAAAAIANFSPNAYARFHTLMYDASTQPEEGSAGLNDARLIAIAKQAGSTNMAAVDAAIRNQTFKNWVASRTDEFASDRGPLRGVDFSRRLNQAGSPAGPGTPTIIVNGQYWDGTTDFGSFITTVGGAVSQPTSTPSSASQ